MDPRFSTSLFSEDPGNRTLYREKWGFQGYTLFFLFRLRHIDCVLILPGESMPVDVSPVNYSDSDSDSTFGTKIRKYY